MITFCNAETKEDFKQILNLQSANLPANLSQEEASAQGFVTVKHDLKLLEEMNHPHKHVIAKHNGQVIGYALVMNKNFKYKIRALIPMFTRIDEIIYQGEKLSNASYFVMGQICIEKEYRGRNIFGQLYTCLKNQMQMNFKYVITEVDALNNRSLRAHEKIGFTPVMEYFDNGKLWNIIIWNWN